MLSPQEFAAKLRKAGIDRAVETIRRWCEKGLPGAKKIGGVWEIEHTTVQLVLDGKWDSRKA